MKKNFKKLFAILMTVAVVLSMAMPVMAAEDPTYEYSLTINLNNEDGGGFDGALKYDIYQLFKADIDADSVPLYTVNEDASALLNGRKPENIAGQDAAYLSQLAQDIVTTKGVTAFAQAETGKAVKLPAGYYLAIPTNMAGRSEDHLAGGTVSGPIFVPVPEITQKPDKTFEITKKDVVVVAKDSNVDTKKEITGLDSNYGLSNTFTSDTATLGADDTITYTITNTVPTYTDDVIDDNVLYFVVDKYDDKLNLKKTGETPNIRVTAPATLTKSLNDDVEDLSVTPKNGEGYTVKHINDGDYWIEVNEAAHTFTVYFNYSAIKNAGGTGVVIEADFTLDNSAVPGTKVNNRSDLTYTNNYYTGAKETLWDEVNSWTFKFNVFKYDTTKTNEKDAPLPGATFELYTEVDEDGQPVGTSKIGNTATSGSDGLVDFGLDLNAGTYYVKETNAPDGYRIDDTVYRVEIKASKDSSGVEYTGDCEIKVFRGADDEVGTVIDTTVENGENTIFTSASEFIDVLGIGNTPGTTLPGTGGIGTTIFTFGGLALIVLAGILLVVYTRKQKKA